MHGPGDVRFFTRFARVYEALMPPARRGPLVDAVETASRPVERVLDLAGGPGRAVRALDVDERVVADASRGMVRRAYAAGLDGVVADAGSLPFRADAFDAVLLTDALHHLPDREAAVAEAFRVCRPGGVLVVRDFDPETWRGRGLVLAERLVGFGSTFATPDDVAARLDDVGFDPSIRARGFSFTVVGRKREGH
jgi:demethylmenaquinone methyltransferase/2-methoxy-6-polyprenyl-1,4-benzoquinol methylase